MKKEQDEKRSYAQVVDSKLPDKGVSVNTFEEEFLYDEPSSDVYSTVVADNAAKIHDLEALVSKLKIENNALKKIVEKYYCISEGIPEESEITTSINVNK